MSEVPNTGIIGAIVLMGQINDGKSDKETHKMIRQIISAMENRKRSEWPNKELRKMVNEFDSLTRSLFLDTLLDMDETLVEAYGIVEDQL
jgi:hypothetical protein